MPGVCGVVLVVKGGGGSNEPAAGGKGCGVNVSS